MARLVAVCRSDDYPFERRQIPLEVDDKLTMVIQFSDSCIGCEQSGLKQKEMERFVQRFHALSSDEVAVAMMVTNKEIFNLLAQMVPCVGCRRSVERLFGQLVNSAHPALEPLVITHGAYLSLKREYLFDPKAIYALFYVHGSRLNIVMESIPKSKKNKRCVLHSLDTHKTKSLGSWMDIWSVLSKECREEVILVECDSLMETLENYLRKHRFCSECKSKVLKAYSLLVNEADVQQEKGFCPQLYEGLRCCAGERHLHVLCETDFIAQLISRAEPELTGSRRERHAKTLDIAQEEVLTCLGIYLYERLHKIWQKLRAEEQTWQILFYLGVDALKKSFEVALERKQGISNLELMCQELLEEEQAKEARRQNKRQKRKKKRGKGKNDEEGEADPENDPEKDKENCKCDENTNITSTKCASCDEHNANMVSVENFCHRGSRERCTYGSTPEISAGNRDSTSNRSDCGYSSGLDGCETCSVPSSHDGSDVACQEGICNHDGDSPLCHRDDLPDVCRDCLAADSPSHSPLHHATWIKKKVSKEPTVQTSSVSAKGSPQYRMQLSLQDMLEASCSDEDEEDGISEEDIQKFRANEKLVNSQRQELREKLRMRFARMSRKGCNCHSRMGDITTDVNKLSMA